MKHKYRTALSFYKQLYDFNFLPVRCAHPSWVESISVPAHIELAGEGERFLSYALLQKAETTEPTLFAENDPLLLIASLPTEKLDRFLRLLLLAAWKANRSLLIDGVRLKTLSTFFTQNEMHFLLFEKKLVFKPELQVNIDLPKKMTRDWVFAQTYPFIHALYTLTEHEEVLKRFNLRFPKKIIETFSGGNAESLFEVISDFAPKLARYAFGEFQEEASLL